MINNISIKIKLFVSAIVPIIGLVVVLLSALYQLKEADLGVARIYDDRVVPLKDLKVIADDYAVSVVDSVNKTNAGIFSAEQALKLISSSDKQIKQKWHKYLSTELTSDEKKLVTEAEVLFLKADLAIEKVVAFLAQSKGSLKGKLDLFDGPLYSTIDPISDKINQLIHLQLAEAQKERLRIEDAYHSTIIQLSSITALIILMTIGLSMLFYRVLITPLQQMQLTIERIASESDLTLSLSDTGTNELGQISKSFNSMIKQMHDIIVHISTVTEQIASASSKMTNISENSNKSIELQNHEIEQVVTAMNQMVATSQEISNNASLADKDALETSHYAKQGSSIVNEAVTATNALVMDVKNVSNRIKTLENESESIGSVVDVIKGIAEQTNLLALNAAIEAARAGDQGRGFAVVADEVRTLAQRTHVSTQEIQEAIERLQVGTNNAVSAMSNGQEKAETAGEKAIEAGEALQTISSAIDNITNLNALIAVASQEQTSVSEEINRSLNKLHEASNDSSVGAQQISQFSAELYSLSEGLETMVKKFRIV